MSEEKPYLTVTLTGRRPVRITKDDWPVIASAEDSEHDGTVPSQANREGLWRITVRQRDNGHDASQTLIYAVHKYSSHFEHEQNRDLRGGELLENADYGDIILAIERVGAELERRLPEGGIYAGGIFPRLVHECIAALPAEEL